MDRTEDQVELIDAIRVLWEYKFMILAGTLICLIAVGIFSFRQPKIYRVDTVILPGEINSPKSRRVYYIDSAFNIKSMIQQGVLRKRMMRHLGKKNAALPNKSFDFVVNIPRKSDIIKISYETPDVETGLAVLNSLIEALTEHYIEKKELLLVEWVDRLNTINSKIHVLNLREAATQKRIETIEAILTGNTGKPNESIDKNDLLSSSLDPKASLQYVELSGLLDEAQIEMIRLREEKKMYLNEVALIEQQNKQFKPIRILTPPKATKDPIKPNIKIQLVGAVIAGFLLMILLAFFIEFFRNLTLKHSKNKITHSTDED